MAAVEPSFVSSRAAGWRAGAAGVRGRRSSARRGDRDGAEHVHGGAAEAAAAR